ncbi:MAG: tetratricopeptide repeat protein, partial [Acidobacteriota bacterium]
YVYRGEQALARGDHQEALTHLREALRRDSEIPEVHLGLVKLYLALGDLRRARHHLRRVEKLDPSHPEAEAYRQLLAESPP